MLHSHTHLRAGPIRLKFADGELRYLCVGHKEIARRVVFVVRDHHWDTAMPEFSRMEVEKEKDSFVIHLEATCRIPTVNYTWRGTITGTADGVITFAASGEALSDFGSNRIGICLLFGSGSLAGHPFETVDAAGRVQSGEFSRLVSPVLLGENFRELRYRTDGGLQVSAQMEGTLFSMEDQRNYADTSYKAYAPLPYAYPSVPAGVRREQVLQLSVEGGGGEMTNDEIRMTRAGGDADLRSAELLEPALTRIMLGGLVNGAKIPKFFRSTEGVQEVDFYAINTQRHLQHGAGVLQFACNPALHLPDHDTFMENAGAVCDQTLTVRSFAHGVKIRIDPVTFNSQHPRPAADSRNATAFGAAWSALIAKYLALAGVDEAAFAVDGAQARAVQEEIGACAGCAVFETATEAIVRPPVEALAVSTGDSIRIWLINTTDAPQRAVLVQNENAAAIFACDLAPHEVVARELHGGGG